MHSSLCAKHTLLGIGAPHLCDATTRGLMCASHLHWAPCENMKSSRHLHRASWEAQWRDHKLRVQRNPADRTHRIPKPGWAARTRRACSPLTLKERARVKGAHCRLLLSPIRTHWSLGHNPVGPPFELPAKKPYHTLNPAVNPLQLPAHRVIVRPHDADTSGAVHTLGLPVATARCQSTLTTRGTRDSGCG
jgi:hypothetical protein